MTRAERAIEVLLTARAERTAFRAHVASPRMITAPSWSGEYGVKIVARRLALDLRLHRLAARHVIAQCDLALERDDAADPGAAETCPTALQNT